MNATSLPRAQELLQRAELLHAGGDLASAAQYYRDVLELQPDHAAALAGLGAIAGQQGRAAEAANFLEQACRLEPANPAFHHNHGEALRHMGQWHLAEVALRRALELDTGFVAAWTSLIALTETAYAQARAARDPSRTDMLVSDLARMNNNQGNAWQASGATLQAIACYQRSLSLRPGNALAWSNLGNALRNMGQLGEAEAACRRAISLDSDLAGAWNHLGNVLVEQGRFDEATPCYERALALQPDFPAALHNFGSGALFNRLYLPGLGNAEIAAMHRTWGAAYPAPRNRRWNNTREPERVLRIGYLSADFRQHAMRHFIEPLLARHRPSEVEVVCYAQGPLADGETRRLMAYGHRWNWVHALTDAELAALIERDAIDILVDCMGHTNGTRITALAGKPAPIMLSWVAYACPTGLPALDGRLTDTWVDPPEPERLPDGETLLRIPGGMMCYRPPADAPEPGPPPCGTRGHITFGSLNNILKVNREIVGHWARLLHAVPGAKLLLQSRLLVDAGTVGRIRGLFEAFGIGAERLDLRPASTRYPHAYPDIDIALDTLPFGGGVTSCDALWMGVPVVTLAGQRPIGRLSVSILNQVGHPEWVAHTPDGYIATAAALASDTEALARIRRGLRAHMRASALCDETGFVQRLEAVYRSSWKRWLAMPHFSKL